TLASQAIRALAAAGISDGGSLLTPLLTAALDGALRGGETNLTGPIVRGSVGAVAEHVAELSALAGAHPELADVPTSYHALARATVQRALAGQRINESQAAALLDVLATPSQPDPTPPATGPAVHPGEAAGRSPATQGGNDQAGASTTPAPGAEPEDASPAVVHTTGELRTVRSTWQGSTAVVMTMGALHAGHLALVRHARTVADHVVVTIFVNPLQFGAGEDLDSYPRTLESDLRDLAGEGVDLVFAPTAAQMYPDGEPQVWVRAGTMGSMLLHLTSPDVAVFGQKDAQQLALVRRMVADTNLPVRIDAVPIVREGDGLALSSRNVYLDDTEREAALVLSRTVAAAESAGAQGLPAEQVRAAAQAVMAEADPRVAAAPQPGERGNIEASGDVAPGSDDVTLVRCNYLELGDEGTRDGVPAHQSGGVPVLVTAALVGQARLVGNAI